MKNVLLLLIFSFSAVCSLSQPEKDKLFITLDNKAILNRLFDGAVVQKNEAIWSPNYYENMNFPISDDGFCHVRIDTILPFMSQTGENVVYIFTYITYSDGIKEACHACRPHIGFALFSKINNIWEIVNFKKNVGTFGNYGSVGDFAITKLGTDFYCLKMIDKEDGNGGYFSAATLFFDLSSFNEIFSFNHFDTNEGAVEIGRYTETTSMNVIQSENYYTIELTTERTDKGAATKVLYKYSENERRYVKSK
jgi:hypothetical protein